MDEIIKDSRFSHIVKDPRFKKLPKKHVKVKIDKRFQSMFNEKKFQIKYNVDKRGRKVKLGGAEDLKRYYELSDSDNDSEDDEDDKESESEKNAKEESGSSSSEEVDEQQDENVIKTSKKEKKTLTAEVKKKLKDLTVDYARGEGAIFSDSSSDEESSGSEDAYEFDHDWGELDKDAEITETATKRLAVCNMNWDRIEAADLMVLFNSFLPPGGLINSITIYPSEFGLQRMKEEDEKGPLELVENVPEGEDDEANQIQMEKLRKYQLNRLKYYYAVIDCDKPETADVLYKECDGLEYESSSNKLDLRFVPDNTVFDQEPKETCSILPDLSTYKPKLFMTSALTKAKCDLTWDETDPNRENIVKAMHSGNIEENHLKKYLASSSSSEESETEANDGLVEKQNMKGLGDIEKYKALLAEVENKEKNNKKNEVNLEVSWNLKLENKANEMVKEAAKEKDKKTPFEQYLEKRKEKKKKKQERRKAQDEETQEGGDSAFSDDDIPSDIDMNDPYFKEEFESVKIKKPGKKKKPKEESDDEESKQKKGELELLMLDNEPENLKHFSLKKIEESEKLSKKKKLKGKKRKLEEANDFKDDFKIDVNDERFSALFTSHHFNIDPADPQFRSTKATKELIEEKLRRREFENENGSAKKTMDKPQEAKMKPKNAELSALVKNIKKKTSEVCKKARLSK